MEPSAVTSTAPAVPYRDSVMHTAVNALQGLHTPHSEGWVRVKLLNSEQRLAAALAWHPQRAFGLQNDCSLSLSLSLTSRGSWQAAAVSCGALQACNGDEDCTAQCCVYDSAVSHPYACDLPLPCALAHGTSFVSQDPMPMTYIPLPSQLLSNSHCQLAWAHSLHLYMPPMLLLYFPKRLVLVILNQHGSFLT